MNSDVLGSVDREFLDNLIGDKLDDWTKARALGEAIVETDPTVLIGHLILSRALRHLGDRPRAIEQLEACLTLAPGVGAGDAAFLPEMRQEEYFLLQQSPPGEIGGRGLGS